MMMEVIINWITALMRCDLNPVKIWIIKMTFTWHQIKNDSSLAIGAHIWAWASCTAALLFLHTHTGHRPYLALDASLAAAAVARVAVKAAVAAAFLPREANGPELGFLPGIDAGDARGSQESAAPLRGQRLKEEAVVHLHLVKVLIRNVLQSQQVRLSAFHRAVPRQLWTTVRAWARDIERPNLYLKLKCLIITLKTSTTASSFQTETFKWTMLGESNKLHFVTSGCIWSEIRITRPKMWLFGNYFACVMYAIMSQM